MDLRANIDQSMNQILYAAVGARRAMVHNFVEGQIGRIVQDGPFAGMALTNESSWDAHGDKTAKLLGFYEEEIYPSLEDAIAAEPDVAINVGCAEGFYAIGLARRLTNSRVIASDIDSRAQEVCARSASANYVATRVQIVGGLDAAGLNELIGPAAKPFVFMDCEGAEMELLDPVIAPNLIKTRFLVELHDFANEAITPVLTGRFSATHDLTFIAEGPRDPNRSPILAKLNSLDRWLAVCENRPQQMSWLYAVPKS
jgi:hypothetical protein